MIVVIPCGAKKLNREAMAKDMYIGSYARMCLRYARSIAPDDRIYILSAKYGLLRLTDIIQPYSLTLGQYGCVSPQQVRLQAEKFGILKEDCVAVGGKRYVELCKLIFARCTTPLQDHAKGGNGKQMQWMRRQI